MLTKPKSAVRTALNIPAQTALPSTIKSYIPSFEPAGGTLVDRVNGAVSLSAVTYSWRGDAKGLVCTGETTDVISPCSVSVVDEQDILIGVIVTNAALSNSTQDVYINKGGNEQFFIARDSYVITDTSAGTGLSDACSNAARENATYPPTFDPEKSLTAVPGEMWGSENSTNIYPDGKWNACAFAWDRRVAGSGNVLYFSNKGWPTSDYTNAQVGEMTSTVSGAVTLAAANSACWSAFMLGVWTNVPAAVIRAAVEWMAFTWSNEPYNSVISARDAIRTDAIPNCAIYPPLLTCT